MYLLLDRSTIFTVQIWPLYGCVKSSWAIPVFYLKLSHWQGDLVLLAVSAALEVPHVVDVRLVLPQPLRLLLPLQHPRLAPRHAPLSRDLQADPLWERYIQDVCQLWGFTVMSHSQVVTLVA